jgi:plasmid stability protein
MIQVRNAPDALHRSLKARAAMAGMSLSDYLLGELREIAERPTLATVRRSVGSRAGARTVGVGGNPIAFAMDRSPATMVTFPAPATSNAACGFPALRFPVCFQPGVMGPIVLGVLSAQLHGEPDSR